MKECPQCKTRYRDDDYYCKRDNYRLVHIEGTESMYFDSFEKSSKEHQQEYDNNKPIQVDCPYCHSKDTTKIATTSKVAHTALFGVFSMSRNSKQWHCNKCKSDF